MIAKADKYVLKTYTPSGYLDEGDLSIYIRGDLTIMKEVPLEQHLIRQDACLALLALLEQEDHVTARHHLMQFDLAGLLALARAAAQLADHALRLAVVMRGLDSDGPKA
jgi:hypothetical protein